MPADNPSVVYETDGQTIARSTDGGCSFTNVYTVPTLPNEVAVPLSPVTGQGHLVEIRKLATPSVGGGRVMALIGTAVSASTKPQTLVATSSDGVSWSLGQRSVPFAGSPLSLSVASPSVAYLLTDGLNLTPPGQNESATSSVYVTSDGGSTWSAGATGLAMSQLRADPTHPEVVYGWGRQGLQVSHDSGATFAAESGLTDAVTDVVANELDGRDTVKVALKKPALLAGPATGLPSDSVGWTRLKTPAIQYLDPVPGFGLTDKGLAPYLFDFVGQGPGYFYVGFLIGGQAHTFDIGPSGSFLNQFEHPLSSKGGFLQIKDASGIWRGHVKVSKTSITISAPPIAPLPPINFPVPIVKKNVPALLPVKQTITIKPGDTIKKKLHLRLPAIPTPLDVMFLVDTTSSMTPTISGLRSGIGSIAATLAATGVDVHFGLGDFQDYPFAPYGCSGKAAGPSFSGSRCTKPDHPYERLLAVSPPGPPFAHALERVLLGDGGDGPEAALPAVYQAVTGAGQMKVPGVPAGGYYTQPNLGANFRQGAVKVLVVATDIGFHAPTPGKGVPCVPNEPVPGCNAEAGYPGPSWAKVISALNQNNIRVVGLDVSGFDNSDAYRDESRLARGAGTLAPAGVDCDGDGHVDLKAGSPLVCLVNPTDDSSALNLAPSIVSLLKALRDLTPVRFSVAEQKQGSPKDTNVARVSPTLVPQVDVKADNNLNLNVTLTCPKGKDSSHTLNIATTIRNQVVARAFINLDCSTPPKLPPSVPVVPAVVAAVVVPVAPPAPPAQLPQQNPNPNPQANVQPGAAAEEQEDPEVAIAGADPVAGPDDEVQFENKPDTMSMSAAHATSTTGAPPGFQLFVIALASVCAAGGAVAVARSRRAQQHAFAWVDRSR